MPSSTDPKDLTTAIRGVELVAAGTWDASTGRTRITAADLQAMVDAAGDPEADAAPVKIGHDDDRFQDADGNPPSTRDGEPAYGWVANLRVNDQPITRKGPDGKTETVPAGNVLLGDLVGVPRKLADIMHTALRRRSVELVRHDRVGGRVYKAVLTGLALLGVQAPAVKGLADLRALFADQLTPTPERFSVEITAPDDGGDTPPVPQPNPPVDVNRADNHEQERAAAMALNLTRDQRRALGIDDGATDDEIRAKLRSLGLRFAEDDSEQQPGSTTVTPDPASPGTPPADPATPPATPPTTPPATPPAPAPTPDPTPPAAAATPPAPPATPPAAAYAAPAADEVTPQRVAAAAAQFGLAVIDQNILNQLTADAGAGRAARDEQNRLRRDGIVNSAVREGKIAPAAFSQFRSHADKDEDGLVTLLAAMPAILPTQPVGHGENLSAGQGSGAEQLSAETKRLEGVYAHFGLTPPAVPAGSKG